MTLMSTNAQALATILWELKRAQKLSTLSAMADRAGFSAGPSCRTVSNCMKTVRRDWPHLEWWRAVADNGRVEQEQAQCLKEAGFATNVAEDGTAVVVSFEDELMVWDSPKIAAETGGDA